MTRQPVNFYETAMQCLWQMKNSFIWWSFKYINSFRRENTKTKWKWQMQPFITFFVEAIIDILETNLFSI